MRPDSSMRARVAHATVERACLHQAAMELSQGSRD
jgi:hypothetical protein